MKLNDAQQQPQSPQKNLTPEEQEKALQDQQERIQQGNSTMEKLLGYARKLLTERNKNLKQ